MYEDLNGCFHLLTSTWRNFLKGVREEYANLHLPLFFRSALFLDFED